MRRLLSQDEEEFIPGEGVDELVASLEAGNPLPPDPEYEGLTPESHEEFTARMNKLAAAYEAQFLDQKDWKVLPLTLPHKRLQCCPPMLQANGQGVVFPVTPPRCISCLLGR